MTPVELLAAAPLKQKQFDERSAAVLADLRKCESDAAALQADVARFAPQHGSLVAKRLLARAREIKKRGAALKAQSAALVAEHLRLEAAYRALGPPADGKPSP